MKKISKILSIILVLAMVMGFALVANAEGVTSTYTFSEYQVDGELGGGEAVRQLDDDVTFTISSGWFSKEARIYKNANAVIASAKDVSSIVLNAGYKSSTFDVYTSVDGSEWSMYQEDVAYVSGYSDVEITFATPVKYIKIDAPNAQVRIKTMSVTFADVAEEEPDVGATEFNVYVAIDSETAPMAWAWGGYGNAFAAWPGEAMTADGDFWKVVVPVGTTGFIVNNGNDTKTSDIIIDGDKDTWIVVSADYSSFEVFYEAPEITPDPVEPTIVDVATALAGANGEEFTVKGVVTCVEGRNVYMMDATDGICIRNTDYVEGLAVGETIIATGTKSVYNGMTQLNGSYEKSEGCELVVNETTIDALTAADVCTYIKLSGVTVVEVDDNNGAYTNPNVTVTDGVNNIQIYKAVVAKNDDGTWAVKVDDKIDVYAAVGCFNEKLQLRNTTADEITVVIDEPEQPDDTITEFTVYVSIESETAPMAWAWGGYGNAFDAAWPGVAMTADGDFWKVVVPVGTNGFIVNNGNGTQTSDITIDGDKDTWIVVSADYSSFEVFYEAPQITPDPGPADPDPEQPTFDTISSALAGADGEEFTVKGVVTCVEGRNVYVMDATGGICIRNADYVEGLAVGETIIATGTKSVYNGMTQLNGSYELSEGCELVVNETTIDALSASDICTYIKLSGVTVTEVFDNDGVYTNPNVTVTDGTNEIQIYKAVVAKNEDGTCAINVGDKIDVYAAVGCFNEKLQLRNTTADEITLVVVEQPENPGEGGEQPENPGEGGEQPENPGEGEVNPGTGDMAIAGLVVAMIAATAGVVVMKKKEF